MTSPLTTVRAILLITIFSAMALAACFGDSGCPTDSVPAVPVLLDVMQDPETLTVTATLRDESDNEQWFILERTFITQFNRTVTVGTSVPDPSFEETPLNRDTDRIVTITDRGIVENQKPIPGQEYVYVARAFNCYSVSGPSNAIKILSLFPQ